MAKDRRQSFIRNPDAKQAGSDDAKSAQSGSSPGGSSPGSSSASRAAGALDVEVSTKGKSVERALGRAEARGPFGAELEVVRAVEPAVEYPELPSVFLKAAAVVAAIAIVWSYWPSWVSLVTIWEREPDYSHGWFVIPITAYMLWNFRSSMPPLRAGLHVGGLVVLATIVMLRIFGRWAYLDFVENWTIPLTVIGLAWVFGGLQWAWWALPSLAFLFFMIPLPFRIEHELSHPLQWIATNMSCFVLQTLGQPAIAEGTTILLGNNKLEVERACSGLRIFMGVVALSYICALLMRRSWWEGVLLVLASVPIALISNAARIVVTGLCYQWFSGEAARRFAHDFSGYVMIVFAAGLFGLTLWYLRWLIQDSVTMDQASLKRV